MKARIENGEPVPDVSRREIKTLSMIVDDAMDTMGAGVVDTTTEEGREKFRGWLRTFLRHAAHDMQWSFTRATESAMKQAAALMEDPKRYERQRVTRKKEKERFRADMERQRFEQANRQKERNENMKQLADEGRLVPMKGFVLNIPCCTGKEEPPKPEGDGA